ncbi:sacsin N-terminal ATP-binding-like domain-containing protein [Rufibacter sediminis]|uniref:DUF3883 domain-containing protein n=1 Tax=Rufibacter sediminis TaxID=2762756 RepID=A0ABR6VQV4_9BACT|nr:DUF3883 domain-containing protein [Rufibacter sediminis]MBC3539582.1 DUF3883 domain-containing protein [Rufibacter sediminis]
MTLSYTEAERTTTIFNAHHNYYLNVGIETIKQQAGQVEQVSADYQGRVIYELLQNAFDKAEGRILVTAKDHCLYIANDGTPFTYQVDFDYKTGTSKRADFQSLCSISTSTKSADTSIGNKGVGFKSAFSIARDNYVQVHTQGEIVQEAGDTWPANISFQIYDSFKDPEKLPETLTIDIRETIKEQIQAVQKENSGRGVPGFYFPIQEREQDDYVQSLFQNGFVTIIQIPFAVNKEEEVKKLFSEIKGIHFEFVQLRITKPITIHFQYEENENLNFTKKSGSYEGETAIVKCYLKDEVKQLAAKAGINVSNPQIAFYLKQPEQSKDNAGVLYNYLPTKFPSPFKNVDFHADFHTTVDRTAINFNGNIGEYNKALFRACLELYFSYLNGYNKSGTAPQLRLKFIKEVNSADTILAPFKWSYLQLHSPWSAFDHVRDILQIWNHNYATGSDFLSSLAKEFFQESRTKTEHDNFFGHTTAFITYFSRDDGQERKWTNYFYTEFARQLKKKNAAVIYAHDGLGISVSESIEFIYREQNEELQSFVPSFAGLSLINYKVENQELRQDLGIREFKDRNEILKHYRQVSPTGRHHGPENQITEEQQRDLLRSISTLMGKTGENILPTHRYNNFITRRNSEDNTTANLADFSLSTVFLKTISGKYKPAQLCREKDLDLSFLPEMPKGISQKTFLQYLGVSFHTSYRFVDLSIWESLKEGLDYIPALWKGSSGNQEDQLRHSMIVDGIRVVANDKAIPPALINDNEYSFLEKLRIAEFKDDAHSLLIKKYNDFPKEYLQQLVTICQNNLHRQEQIIRLYQKIFEPLAKRLQKYLVFGQKELAFVYHTDFYIVQNESEFKLAASIPDLDKPVLAYHKSKVDPEAYHFKGKVLKITEAAIVAHNQVDKTELYLQKLLPKLVYVLLEISQSTLSETDYFEEPEKIAELSKRLQQLRFYEADKLTRDIQIGNICKTVERSFDTNEEALFLSKGLPVHQQAEAIAKGVFNNTRIAKALELIVFHKEEEVLREEYQAQLKINQDIFRRYWISDYDTKFKAFSKEIFSYFNQEQLAEDSRWHVYNANHQSRFLEYVFRRDCLNELELVIHRTKAEFSDGIFADFNLDIDLDLYHERLAKLRLRLEQADPETSKEFQSRLQALFGKMGIAKDLERLEADIELAFPEQVAKPSSSGQLADATREVSVLSRIERIFQGMSHHPAKTLAGFQPSAAVSSSEIPVKTKKVIYKGNSLPATDAEVTGANGEEEVLGYLIRYFLQMEQPEDRKHAINEVFNLICTVLGKDEPALEKHRNLYQTCLDYIEDEVALAKALIPFFYLTLHYKFAFTDLVAWHEGQAVLVEVKTTQNPRNNNFRISGSEINIAKSRKNYLIVRVTPDEMIFMGNPIYGVLNKIEEIRGENFRIQPYGYTFEFDKQILIADTSFN